jgi:hypothetical protein
MDSQHVGCGYSELSSIYHHLHCSFVIGEPVKVILGNIPAFDVRIITRSAGEQLTRFLRLHATDRANKIHSVVRRFHVNLLPRRKHEKWSILDTADNSTAGS